MRNLVLLLWNVVVTVFVALQVNNLIGYPRLPSDDDDDLLTAGELSELRPDLSYSTLLTFRNAVSHHLQGDYFNAVRLYEEVSSATLKNGETIDLFVAVPKAEVNYMLAKLGKTKRSD